MILMLVKAKNDPIDNLQDDDDDYEELGGNLINEDFQGNGVRK